MTLLCPFETKLSEDLLYLFKENDYKQTNSKKNKRSLSVY